MSKLIGVTKVILCVRNWLDRTRQRMGVNIAPRPSLEHIERSVCMTELIKASQVSIRDDDNLKQMSPFVDECGVLRVGGRIKHAKVPFDSRHPFILPRKSNLALLVVRYYHCKNKHQGRTVSLAAVRYAGFFLFPGVEV